MLVQVSRDFLCAFFGVTRHGCADGEEIEDSGGFPPGELQKYVEARKAGKSGNHRRLARRMRHLKAEKKAAKEAREKSRQVNAEAEAQEEMAWAAMKASLAARGKCRQPMHAGIGFH